MHNNILLLHIGTPKTGTTSLQKFFFINKETLKENNWEYPFLLKYIPSPNWRVNEVIFNNGAILYDAILRKDKEIIHRVMQMVVECLRDNSVILSCECFWDLDLRELLSIVKEYWKEVRVVLYLRRQDEFIESEWSESVKIRESREQRTLEEYVTDCLAIHQPNYLEKLRELDSLPIGYLDIRVFEKNSFLGKRKDIISDFLSVLGLDESEDKWKFPGRENERPAPFLIEAKRIFNKLCSQVPISKNCDSYFFEFNHIWKIVCAQGQNDVHKVMSPDIRKKILTIFNSDNKLIAKKYLGRNGNLFANTDTKRPVCEYPHLTVHEEMWMALMFYLLHQREKNFEELQKNTQYFYNQLVALAQKDARSRKKHLAYFGAGNICTKCLDSQIFFPDIIIDNYKKDMNLKGIPVISSDEIQQWESYLIIITCAEYQAVQLQLSYKGLLEGKDFISWDKIFIW